MSEEHDRTRDDDTDLMPTKELMKARRQKFYAEQKALRKAQRAAEKAAARQSKLEKQAAKRNTLWEKLVPASQVESSESNVLDCVSREKK